MDTQEEILAKTIHEWQGDAPQIDDISVLGVKL